ncbi:MAG: DEAD/DEAH box helicase [Butyrivibrio sp.]
MNRLDERIAMGLAKTGIRELTDIQKECFEPTIKGENIIGCSGTGTGKTFAYLLPVIMNNMDNKSLYCIILAPSKELCIQICTQINLISNQSGIPITAAALFGGVNKQRQLQTLKSKPNIVVGTYQRVHELIKEKRISVHNVRTFIIDEADRILTKDTIDDVAALRKCCMRDTQIMLFSASINEDTQKYGEMLSDKSFVKVFTKEKITIPVNIKHVYLVVERRDKTETARKLIKALNSKHCMIFANSKYDTEEITQKLKYYNYNAACLHARCDKNEKRHIIDGFSNNKINYLICSDIAARGLDFRNVDAVINIGLPEKAVDYLHRAGRCGRNGETAVCASIITESELKMIQTIRKTFSVNILQKKLYNGQIVRK